MRPDAAPFDRRSFLGGLLVLAAFHLVCAGPVYFGDGAPVTKDLVLSYQPMHATLARQGWPVFRLWEPRGGLGFPMLAESQASQLYPPSVVARLLLDPDLGIFPLIYLHLLLTGVFMLALARELRLPPPAACLAALAWMGCGFTVSHLDIPPMLFQATWLPAAAAALVRHFRTGRLLPLGAAAGALGCMLLAGHFQVAFYGLLFLFAWCWFLPTPAAGDVPRGRAIGAMAVVTILALALSYAQVKPTLDFLLHSSRSELGGGTWLSWLPLQLPALVQPFLFGIAVRPTLVGSVPSGLSTYWGAGVYWETALYVGLVPLLLAVSAWPRDRRDRFLWGAVALALLLAAGRYVPGHGVLWRLPLWGSFRFPARLLMVAQFCLALLAGIGASRLAELDAVLLRRLCRRWLWAALTFFVALGLAWAFARRLAAAPGSSRAAAAALTLDPATGPNLRLLLLASLVGLCLTAAARAGGLRSWLPWLLVAVAAVDLGYYFRAQQVLAPAAFYSRSLPPIGGCDPAEPEQRYYSVARFGADALDHQLDLLPPSLNLRTSCSAVDYRGSLYDARLSRYAEALLEAYADPEGRVFQAPSRLKLFALGGVRHIVRRQPASGAGLALLEHQHGRWLYELTGAAPALRRAAKARYVASGERAWQLVSGPGFDARRDLVIEGPGGGAGAGEDPAASVVVVSREATRLELLTRGSRPGWLVWSQAFSPRWRATIEGEAAPLRRANYLFQALAVPAGESRVRLEYSEPAIVHGAVAALLALGVFALFAWLDLRRGRRRASERGEDARDSRTELRRT